MKSTALFIAVLIALSAQTSAAHSQRHLVYEFGFNTKVASSGNGTGTTTIDIMGPAKDGGVMISGTDYWWNTARPRATNTCEVYPDGGVSCQKPAYAISPIQFTLFPLLGKSYFHPLSTGGGHANWSRTYQVEAAILPGASGVMSQLTTFKSVYTLQGKGKIANAGGTILVEATGKLTQQGGRYLAASSKQRIAYDPAAGIPVVVSDVRTHLPMRSVYSNDLVELKLKSDSR
ncbi:MAG TPA: hypothetical protein VMT95_02095 [Candidatus Binatia bacterium]|nr:hypothetical protein [Candidatus Binatia bacterium]